MARSTLVVGVMLCAGLVMSGIASGQFYFDIWPSTVDGCQNCYPDEGYAITGDGQVRFSKSYHHMVYMGFGQVAGDTYAGLSDGPDGIPAGRSKGGVNDSDDGVLLDAWLPGKKAFHAALYLREAYGQTCDPFAAAGTYINDPVTIVGFRVGNDGPFVDRGDSGNGFTGCCAGYLAPLLEGGENAPGAWRMGDPYVDRAGVLGYAQQGDINKADPKAEWYKTSAVDSLYPSTDVKVGSAGFGTTGFGGNSTNVPGMTGSSRWAFDYVTEKSDAMLINSATLNESDCTGFAGEEEPRDFANDMTIGEGWFAEVVDRCIIQALITPSDITGILETKGIVCHSANTPLYLNPLLFTWDQSGGSYGPYLAITATLDGDGSNNDGYVDVVDLLDLVAAFGSAKGDANFNPEVDWNCDTYVDVVDLLTLVGNFGLSVWP